MLTAESSAFVAQSGDYYDEDLPDLVDYADGDSPYLSDTAGLFRISTYYDATSQGIDEDTAGGVEGYAYQQAVAHGEDAARTAIGQSGGPVLLSTYDYYARTVDDVTIYPSASQTTYANEDGTGAITTDYAYTWYSGTFQIQEQTTTLPAVSTNHNGSGTSATRKQWFDDDGNLAWTMDELGRATYYEYDSLTGRLAETIADIDDATADDLELDIPTGWTLPASGGANQTTRLPARRLRPCHPNPRPRPHRGHQRHAHERAHGHLDVLQRCDPRDPHGAGLCRGEHQRLR